MTLIQLISLVVQVSVFVSAQHWEWPHGGWHQNGKSAGERARFHGETGCQRATRKVLVLIFQQVLPLKGSTTPEHNSSEDQILDNECLGNTYKPHLSLSQKLLTSLLLTFYLSKFKWLQLTTWNKTSILICPKGEHI